MPPFKSEGRDIHLYLRAILSGVAVVASLAAVTCGGSPGPARTPTSAVASPSSQTPARTASPTPTVPATAGAAYWTPTPSKAASPAAGEATATPATVNTTTPARSPLPASPVPTPTALALAPQSRGGTLRTAMPAAPAHYDIHQDASPALVQWGPGIAYSRLFRFRSGPGVETPNGEVECDLCEAWMMTGPATYEVTLRSGVRWQNLAPVSGRPLTAADIVFSLLRQSTPGWPNAPVLSTVSGIVASGDRTVRFTLTRPDAEFLERLADGHSRIVAPEVVGIRGDLLAGPTIGTGPWQLLEASESAFKYVANPGYFEPGVPAVDFLQVVVLPSDGVRASALRTHNLDFVSVGAAELSDAVHSFPDLLWSKTIQPGAGVEVALNANVKPFDSIDARRTALLALDPWRDINEIWLGGAAVTAGLPVPSASWLLTREALAEFMAQPRRAAELATTSGITQGREVEITVAEFGPEYAEQALRIARDLAAVGFRPALQRVSTRKFADDIWFGGKFQMFVGAQPPVSSLSDYLVAVHHSRGPWNTTGYRSPELDALIEAQSVATDPARRRQLLLEIQTEIMRGAYRFSPATLYTHWAWWPGVEGFGPNTYRGESYFLARMWLSRQ